MPSLDSAVDSPVTPRRSSSRRLSNAERTAIVAAVATGKTQAQVAKQFDVHPNTVATLCKSVRELNHPGNPLSKDWAEFLVNDAVGAITAGLRQREDVQAAGELGVKVMTGLGKFTSGNNLKVDAVSNVVIQWGRSDEPQQPPIDVTPEE